MRAAIRADKAYALVSALGEKEYVFGGYVRDKLADIIFSDLDLCFENDISFADWRFKTAKSNKIRWDFISYNNSDEYDNIHFELQTWRGNYEDGSSIDISTYIPRNKSIDLKKYSPVDKSNVDLDVNCLKHDKRGVITTMFSDLDLTTVIDNCKNKKYTIINNNKFTALRKRKMELKGFPNTSEQVKKTDNKVISEMKNDTTKDSAVPTTITMFERFKKNAVEGAYLGTAMTITDGTQAAILAFLKDEGVEESAIPAIAKFFGTNIGKALIATAAGTGMQFGMQFIPTIADNAHANKIADKLQENGAALGMTAAQKLMFEYMAPMIMGALNKIPVVEPVKARIAQPATGVSMDALKEHQALIEAQAEMVGKKSAVN
jgi:predicted nucleotidyltransferase